MLSLLNKDAHNFSEEETPDIEILLNEIQHYQAENGISNIGIPDNGIEVPDISISTDKDIDKIFETLAENSAKESVGCGNCSSNVRVEQMSSLQSGQHISVSGQIGRKHTFGKQLKFYSHHAIIKNVVKIENDNQKAEIELIHFWRDEDNTLSIIKSVEIFDLRTDEISIIQYLRPKYNPADVVKRAESQLKKKYTGLNIEENVHFETYKFLTKNCEHFASWCIIGEEECFQVQVLREYVERLIGGLVPGMLSKLLFKILYMSSDEITKGIARTGYAPVIVLAGTGGVYLLYCVLMTVLYRKQRKSGTLCQSCFTRKWKKLWLNFSLYAGVSTASILIAYLVLPLFAPGVAIPGLVLLVLAAVALQWTAEKLLNYLKSPFQCSKTQILELDELQQGDVITIKDTSKKSFLKSRPVTMIVADVDLEEKMITSIYCKKSRIGKVVKQDFRIDLKTSTVLLYNLEHHETYSRDEVVRQAMNRIGEEKHHFCPNISEKFCFDVKIKQAIGEETLYERLTVSGESANTDLSSFYIGETEVHSTDEIHSGTALMIKSSLFKKMHCIVVEVAHTTDRKCIIDVVRYGREEEPFFAAKMKQNVSINLNADRVYIVKYHQSHCCRLVDRVRRAKQIIEQGKTFLTGYRFIEACVILKPIEWISVHNREGIKKGDIVHCKDGKEKGIVIEVKQHGENNNTVDLGMLIYNKWRPTFVCRSFDFSKESVFVMKRLSSVCYDRKKCLERALAIKEHCKRGRSWTKTGFIDDCVYIKSDGKVNVIQIEELHPGDVVEYKGIGVLTGLTKLEQNDYVFSMTRVIYRKRNWKSSTESHIIDLRKDTIYLVKYGSSPTYPSLERIMRAQSFIGKKMFSWTESDFVKECVVQKKTGSLLLHRMNHLSAGDVIEYPVKGIIVAVECTDNLGKQCDITLITYKKFKVIPETISIDLHTENVIEKRYPSSQCYSQKERIQRAVALMGKYCRFWTQFGFIEECILTNNTGSFERSEEYEVRDFAELTPGDVIINKQSRSHGIVCEIKEGDITKKKARVKYIVNTQILDESFDLRRDTIYVKGHNQYKHYSKEHCLQRAYAMSLKGAMYKTHEEFVGECIMTKKDGTATVYTYTDIKIGDVIRFMDHSGIIVDLKPPTFGVISEFDMKLVSYNGGQLGYEMFENVNILEEQLSIHIFTGDKYFSMLERKKRALAIFDLYSAGTTLTENEFTTACIKKRQCKNEKVRAYLSEDILPGDVVETEDYKGIVIPTESNSGQYFIEMIVCEEDGKLKKKSREMKFQEQKIFVETFLPDLCFSHKIRVARALTLLEQGGDEWTTNKFVDRSIKLKY